MRAVGILTRSSIASLGRDMCFTPIQDVLRTFAADLLPGSFAT